MAESPATRIYVVRTTKEAPGIALRLVRASNPAQATRHVANAFLTCDVASQDDCIAAATDGVKVETAGSGSDS